jgi:hypothetical protein
MTALRQVTLTAAGVMLAAGIYEVVRAFDPPAMGPSCWEWPASL